MSVWWRIVAVAAFGTMLLTHCGSTSSNQETAPAEKVSK